MADLQATISNRCPASDTSNIVFQFFVNAINQDSIKTIQDMSFKSNFGAVDMLSLDPTITLSKGLWGWRVGMSPGRSRRLESG